MTELPHISIARQPRAGVVAVPSHDHHVTDHLLRRVGFEPAPDSRLYSLTEPRRDPVRRTQLAVQSLRAARQNDSADADYDLYPGEHSALSRGPEKQPPSAQQRRATPRVLRPPPAQTALPPRSRPALSPLTAALRSPHPSLLTPDSGEPVPPRPDASLHDASDQLRALHPPEQPR